MRKAPDAEGAAARLDSSLATVYLPVTANHKPLQAGWQGVKMSTLRSDRLTETAPIAQRIAREVIVRG